MEVASSQSWLFRVLCTVCSWRRKICDLRFVSVWLFWTPTFRSLLLFWMNGESGTQVHCSFFGFVPFYFPEIHLNNLVNFCEMPEKPVETINFWKLCLGFLARAFDVTLSLFQEKQVDCEVTMRCISKETKFSRSVLSRPSTIWWNLTGVDVVQEICGCNHSCLGLCSFQTTLGKSVFIEVPSEILKVRMSCFVFSFVVVGATETSLPVTNALCMSARGAFVFEPGFDTRSKR